LESLQQSLDLAQNQLLMHQRSVTVIDSMMVHSKDWSLFLDKLVARLDRTPHIWLTEITSTSKNEIDLVGYSLYRNRITRLVEGLKGVSLKSVEVLEIREKTVYKFLLNATL
jgi:hypothetical protein